MMYDYKSLYNKRIFVDANAISYREGLLEDIRMPSDAAAYLNAALEDGSYDGFLMAVRDVAEAMGMSWFPKRYRTNRKRCP